MRTLMGWVVLAALVCSCGSRNDQTNDDDATAKKIERVENGLVPFAPGSSDSARVTETSIFQAASTTKLVVSAIALRFVEKGKFDLDTDVNAYLRSWKVPENEFTSKEKVTLRRLLTHRSGLNRPEGGFSRAEGRGPTLVQERDRPRNGLRSPRHVIEHPRLSPES